MWSFDDLFIGDSSALAWKCPGLLSGLFICLRWQCRLVGSPSWFPLMPYSSCILQLTLRAGPGAGGVLASPPTKVPSRAGLEGGAAHVALKKPHLQDQGPFQDALGVELLQAQMLALLFLSCAPQANGSYEGIKTRISRFLVRRAYVKHLALVK